MVVLLVLFFVGFPALLQVLAHNHSIVRRISPIVICYVAGILLGNSSLLPAGAARVQDLLSSVAVPLAIPFMLFSMDIRQWGRLAGKSILSLALAAFAVVVASLAGHLLFRSTLAESWKLAGMLIGVYTGGTPNLAAIKAALDVDTSLYLAAHTSDVVVSGVYILFLITAAKPLFSRVLPAFAAVPAGRSGGPRPPEPAAGGGEAYDSFTAIVTRREVPPLLAALGAAVLVAGTGVGLGLLFPPDYSVMITILAITTFSILASLVPAVRRIPHTFQVGHYIILVFCTVVGSMADLRTLLAAAPGVLVYVTVAVFGSLLLHLLLCRAFRIDVDTMILTSTSAICSPPFVGMVAVAIRNTALIPAGITTGIIGYAIGNYLGIAVAWLFRALLP